MIKQPSAHEYSSTTSVIATKKVTSIQSFNSEQEKTASTESFHSTAFNQSSSTSMKAASRPSSTTSLRAKSLSAASVMSTLKEPATSDKVKAYILFKHNIVLLIT